MRAAALIRCLRRLRCLPGGLCRLKPGTFSRRHSLFSRCHGERSEESLCAANPSSSVGAVRAGFDGSGHLIDYVPMRIPIPAIVAPLVRYLSQPLTLPRLHIDSAFSGPRSSSNDAAARPATPYKSHPYNTQRRNSHGMISLQNNRGGHPHYLHRHATRSLCSLGRLDRMEHAESA